MLMSRHLILPWLVPMLLLGALLLLNGRSAIGEWKLASAQVQSCDASAPEWASVRLSYFSRTDCRLLRLSSTQRTTGWGNGAIALGSVTRDVRVYVNGEMVRDFVDDADATFTNRPILIAVAGRLLHPADNEILIHLRSRAVSADYTSLRSVYFGPERILAPAWEASLWVGARGAQIAMAVVFAITLFLVPIALTRRQESIYRWFLLTLASSALYVANFALVWRPLPLLAWGLLIHTALAMALWALLKFSNRFLGRVPDVRERQVGWAISLACVLLTLSVTQWFRDMAAMLLDAGYRVTMLAVLGYLAHLFWSNRGRATTPKPAWFAGGVALVAALGVVDSLHVFGLIRADLASYTMHWGMLYLLILLFAALAFRILHALGSAERARGELAVALAERSAELEAEFSLRREAEQARTLAEERHRIMRDMHDGVGGQLVALIGQAQMQALSGSELQHQLRGTLDDLRLMIDSLDEACADLSVALGMFRKRMEPSLARLSVQVQWHTAHLPDLPAVSPTIVLNVMRIVQEAITNVLKHAHCKQLQVAAEWHDGLLTISISDSGIGMGASAGAGRGLASMRERARIIAGELQILDNAPGTRVQLSLQL